MTEWSGHIDQGKELRCDLCGKPVGHVLIEQVPLSEIDMEVRCYACAVSEEAESILKEQT